MKKNDKWTPENKRQAVNIEQTKIANSIDTIDTWFQNVQEEYDPEWIANITEDLIHIVKRLRRRYPNPSQGESHD